MVPAGRGVTMAGRRHTWAGRRHMWAGRSQVYWLFLSREQSVGGSWHGLDVDFSCLCEQLDNARVGHGHHTLPIDLNDAVSNADSTTLSRTPTQQAATMPFSTQKPSCSRTWGRWMTAVVTGGQWMILSVTDECRRTSRTAAWQAASDSPTRLVPLMAVTRSPMLRPRSARQGPRGGGWQ